METIREVQVPRELVGSDRGDVYKWAREQLHGQEADLSQTDVDQIRNGEVHVIRLQPKKEGFFLPDGDFVEAFDHSLSFGDDLGEAEEQWEMEEEAREWVDEENERFNKTTVDSETRIWETREHGKRLAEYIDQHDMSASRMKRLLPRRAGPDGYGRWTHETALRLYKWKPEAVETEPVFQWSYGLLDAVLAFSSENNIRDYLEVLVTEYLHPAGTSDGKITEFLRGPGQSESDLWEQSRDLILPIYQRISDGHHLTSEEMQTLVRILD